ncbi:MAG: rod shape-determining protein MreD [Gammaproteobacteria bacterium]|nr:rod shape-determining protein MreD [Gammaproteobacteria bacterium]
MSENKAAQGTSVIILTFLLAMILTILPMPEWAGYIRPEWVGLVLVYWCMALPTRVNVGVGWVAGIIVDVLNGSLLGQHAMAYAVIAYVTVKLHKQIRIYPLWQQALSIFTLIALSQLLIAWIRGIVGDAPNSWLYWLPSLTSAVIWPWLYLLLRDVRRKFRVS